jgi:acetyl esterase/lipase
MHAASKVSAQTASQAPPSTTPTQGIRALMNLTYLNEGGRQQHLDLFVPTGPAPAGGRPVILALPGGGWRWVRRGDMGAAVSQFARHGYVVAVADYAFASATPGTHVWPTDFQDVRQAVVWLKDHAAKYGIDPSKVAVWGESAGGNLASLLGTNPNGPLANPGHPSPPAADVSARVQAVVDFYGPADLTKLYQEDKRDRPYLSTFLGGTPQQVPDRYAAASPITYVSPQSPPFLIMQGTADNANLADQSEELGTALALAGVPVQAQILQGLPHGFRLKVGPGVDYTSLVLDFLNTSLHVSPAGATR